MYKTWINFILRIIISIGIHMCWLWLYFSAYVLSEDPIKGGKFYKIAKFYFADYWKIMIPLTGIVFNLVLLAICKLLPIRSKILVRVYWCISIFMSCALMFPFYFA